MRVERRIKGLLAIAVVVAACGGSTPRAAPAIPSSGPAQQLPTAPPAIAPQPTPLPSLAISPACNADFVTAAAVDEMQDSVRDLYPAVRDCKSLEEWSAAFIAHDGAGFIGDPIEFLRNACRGPAITDEPLCKSVPSAVDVPPDVAAIAEQACADTTYTGCIEGVRLKGPTLSIWDGGTQPRQRCPTPWGGVDTGPT